MVAQKQHLCSLDRLITELAALWGVQTGYRDATGVWRESPRGAVMQVLGALSACTEAGPWPGIEAVESLGSRDELWLRHALEARRTELRRRLVEPVLVAWDGILGAVGRRSAAEGIPDEAKRASGVAGANRQSPKRARLVLSLEEGGEEREEADWDALRAVWRGHRSVGPFRERIPFGYHRFRLETGDRVGEATVISAPRRCWAVEPGSTRWGLFAPLYALRSERNWGAGDLADMEELLRAVAAAGGSEVATLPLLAAYLDHPFEPAPYTPVSRLFWNEFYLAVDQIAEWTECAQARAIWSSRETQERVARWRAEPLVDYAAGMALKRGAVNELCQTFFQRGGTERQAALAAYLRGQPHAVDYADFRARVEAFGGDWREWPEKERTKVAGSAKPEELSKAGRYHLYCQWQMEEQLSRFSGGGSRWRAEPGQSRSAGLFLDLPVGVHPGGFDTWRWHDLFVEGMSIGAPPDAFFAQGQRWDSPPLHPERIREQGHSYYVQVLRQHMRHAGSLRIDHIMALHRLFWVPEDRKPSEGVYVTYPADELYAALCVESYRQHTVVVGEDLGTVPAGVRSSMRRHGVLGTWVLQSAAKPRAARAVAPIPRQVVAALGTHDMFPLAGFLRGDDICARVQTGQLGPDAARRAIAARRKLVGRLSAFLVRGPASQAPDELLAGALSYLGASGAAFVLVNLDDLLLQTEPQNVPGTGSERGNWRRRFAGERAEVERAISTAALGLKAS